MEGRKEYQEGRKDCEGQEGVHNERKITGRKMCVECWKERVLKERWNECGEKEGREANGVCEESRNVQ